jgi:hypothetical protein
MLMPRKRKTSGKEEAPAKEEPKASVEVGEIHIEKAHEEAGEAEAPAAQPQKERGSGLKVLAVIVLLLAVLALGYYFLVQAGNRFDTGAQVDQETFTNNFLNAEKVYIVMDVRGVQDDLIRQNVIQCGVDFAQSAVLGEKGANQKVIPLSFDDSECVAPDGPHPAKDCFEMLKDGQTIYVKEGTPGVKYYSNGMVVTIGREYYLGGCSIKKV